MKDNIRPDHYRTGEIDLYEAWYRTYPFDQYRAIMQAVAERYMRRNKNDRVEDLGKAIYTMERLKEKEIEHAGESEEIEETTTKDGVWQSKTKTAGQYLDEVYYHHDDLLKRLWNEGYCYLARDEYGDLWAFYSLPSKSEETGYWDVNIDLDSENILDDNFPEVKWSDEEPTIIADLLATYENGGENGKVEQTPLYYAKIKGWELTEGESVFWKSCIITENPMLPRLYTGSKEEDGFVRTKMTIQYWNKVGINETNADFERVE